MKIIELQYNDLTKEEQMNLVKISSLTFYINEYPKDIKSKIKTALTNFSHQWYFHVDQRSEIESELIKENQVLYRKYSLGFINKDARN